MNQQQRWRGEVLIAVAALALVCAAAADYMWLVKDLGLL